LKNLKLTFLLTCIAATTPVHAALVAAPGGVAYYDTVLDITWQANANLSAGNTFDVTGVNAAGGMSWSAAQNWLTAMNDASYLGVDTWRLPENNPVNGSSYDVTQSFDGSTDQGYNLGGAGSVLPGTTVSEMAYMYYTELGNLPYQEGPPVAITACGLAGTCLANTGPVANLLPELYWGASPWPDDANQRWAFSFETGEQRTQNVNAEFLVWAVADGNVFNVQTVPVPAAVWLFASALIGLAGLRRRLV